MGRRADKKSKKNLEKGMNIHNSCGIYKGTYKKRYVRTPLFLEPIMGDWHMGLDHNPIEDIEALREAINGFCFPNYNNSHVFHTSGNCAVCGFQLSYKYPDDYPDEWKFCCFCQPMAKKLIDGTVEPTTDKLKKLYDKITLVKGNE